MRRSCCVCIDKLRSVGVSLMQRSFGRAVRVGGLRDCLFFHASDGNSECDAYERRSCGGGRVAGVVIGVSFLVDCRLCCWSSAQKYVPNVLLGLFF